MYESLRVSSEQQIQIRVARSDADYRDVIGLRETVYVQETQRLAGADSMRDTFDRFNDHATYILARLDGRPSGTLKVIADSDAGLPCEWSVRLDDLRRTGRLTEFGHLITAPEVRGQGIAMRLMRAALAFAVTRLRATHIVGDFFVDGADKGTLPSFYTALGFRSLSEPYRDVRFSGAPLSVVAVLDIEESASMRSASRDKQRKLLDFFFDEHPFYGSCEPEIGSD